MFVTPIVKVFHVLKINQKFQEKKQFNKRYMNTLKITTFILIGLIGYVVIKFIYKNFMKIFELKEPERIMEQYVDKKVTEKDDSNTIEEFYQFFRDQFDDGGKPTMEDIVRFIDTKKEAQIWISDHRIRHNLSDSFKYKLLHYKLLHFSLFTNQEINDLVSGYKKYILDIEKENERINNIMNTGFYASKDGQSVIDFSKITLIINSEASVCHTTQSGNYGTPQRQTKPARTIVICENVTTEIPLMQELPELFNKWKNKQTLI